MLRHFGDTGALQEPFDVAVVMPSVVRPSLARALRSSLAQDHPGRIQALIGIDRREGDLALLKPVLDAMPPRRVVTLLDPGYSTSVRHGGLHPARDGGVLRCILTYLANARRVAYLDDDNWWARDHLRLLGAAIEGKAWAYGFRCFVHPETNRLVAIDTWESIGPGRGGYAGNFGGWVDPNCLMIDKLACEPVIRRWAVPLHNDRSAMSADRNVFRALQRYPSGESRTVSVFYTLNPSDGLHAHRMTRFKDAYEQAGNPDAPPVAITGGQVRLPLNQT